MTPRVSRPEPHGQNAQPVDVSGFGDGASGAERALWHAYRNSAYAFPKLREPCTCGGEIVSQNTWKDIRAAVNRHSLTERHEAWRVAQLGEDEE